MNKIIVHPGNGVNFPKIGEYIKLNMVIYDANRNILFDSKDMSEDKCLELRYKFPESNFLTELEDLIGEMSLYEKCLLIFDKSSERTLIESELIKELVEHNKEVTFDIEIVDINKNSHN